MDTTQIYRSVACKMIDGTTIRGQFYQSRARAPAVIMTQGFNCVKEITLPDIAEIFNAHGYNVYLYDARSVGDSNGTPRNLLDPLQMAEDLSGGPSRSMLHLYPARARFADQIDIYTYVASLPSVDSGSIALWGVSFGAAVSACSAAIDRRPRALIMVCPLFSYVQPHKADEAFSLLIKDRVSQLRGNEPYSVASFGPDGDNLIGMGGAGGPGGIEAYNLVQRALNSNHGNFTDMISLQTYHKLAVWRPTEYMNLVKTPTMMIIPELDNVSSPEEQRDAFDRLSGPKKLHWAAGQGHLSVVSGEGSVKLVKAMINYLEAVFNGELDKFKE